MKKRIEYIDFLKFFGLTCIILAHCKIPDTLFMIREFDVILMVIVSSYLASYSIKKYNNNFNSIKSYYNSRFKRLVIPTWNFLIIYFIFRFVFYNDYRNGSYYLFSFLLTRYGVAYVWIISIYFLSAFLMPVYRKIGYKKKNFIMIVSIYLLYELLWISGIKINNRFIVTMLYMIPYGMISYIGYCFDEMSNKDKKFLILTNGFIFTTMFFYYLINNGSIELIENVKYPPRLYYISYGIFCSLLLMTICNKFNFKIFKNKIIVFISKNSLWIYLWHILILDFIDLKKWYINFILVYIISIIIVYIFNKIKKIFFIKNKKAN